MSEQPHNSDGYQLEALHMAHVFGEMIDAHLVQHHFCAWNPELRKKAEAAVEALGDLYQAIANAETVAWSFDESTK
jgi:hypothetical protein